jgi:multiple sugar transport system ATP-binding protein
MASLELSHVFRVIGGGQTVLHDIDFSAHHGELISVVGPSGCGKSTLLRSIAGLEEVTSGDIFIGGNRVNDLQPQQRRIAMVFQNHALYPHMTVYQNLAFGLRARRVARSVVEARVRRTAVRLGLEALLGRYPRELSGGQKQRTALGRAMLRDPEVFLLDEPLSSLDVPLRSEMRRELMALHKSLGMTMVYVTHDQSEALSLGERVVVLSAGKIQQIDTPQEIYGNPQNRFVAAFVGWPPMNFLNGEILGAHANDTQNVEYGIRPERLMLQQHAADDLSVSGRIECIESLGGVWQIEIIHNGGRLIARVPPDAALRQDAELRLWFNQTDLYAFNRTTGTRVKVNR